MEEANSHVDRSLYVIRRPTHSTNQLDSQLEKIEKPKKTIKDYANSCAKSCTIKRIRSAFIGCFPFLNWLKAYNVKEWLLGDLISGITVGIVHIPQSMAFSLLTGLAPVFGLYTSFFPVLVYTLMGTSRHISIGSFAVTSLLTRSAVVRIVPEANRIPSNITNSSMFGFDEFEAKRALVASAVAFLTGIFQLILGMFHLGFIISFLSSPIIKALTTGAAIFVVTSQVPNCLGVVAAQTSGFGIIVRQWIEIFRVIGDSNLATVIISIICIIVLIIGRHINLKYKNKLKVPIPTEVGVVVVAILASQFGEFNKNFKVGIVGNIPTGFPKPTIPDLDALSDVIGDSISIAIVGLVINISLAKMYGVRFDYEIEANQEMIAYGFSNFIPSFFFCFPSAAALARCEIQVNTGGKTQMVGVITVIVILATILGIGPYFEPLPRSVLGSIIIVGLVGILAQLGTVRELYQKSKFDFLIWFTTFFSIMLFGISVGLLIGVVFGLLIVILRTQRPTCEQLGSILNSDIYRSFDRYKSVELHNAIKIFKFNSILYYANIDYFLQSLMKATGINPDKKSPTNQAEPNISCTNTTKFVCESNIKNEKQITIEDFEQIQFVIIDCSTFIYLDLPALEMLKTLCTKYKKIGIQLILVNVHYEVRDDLKKNGFYDTAGEDGEFLTIHDAVLFCQKILTTQEMENFEGQVSKL